MLKKLLLIAVLSCGAALPAFADAVSDKVVANLRAQGFEVVQMDRTWLGRMWILARNDEVQREVVFNPVTGEILRDYTVLLASLQPVESGDDQQHIAQTGAVVAPPPILGSPPVAVGADPTPPLVGSSDVIFAPPINPVQ